MLKKLIISIFLSLSISQTVKSMEQALTHDGMPIKDIGAYKIYEEYNAKEGSLNKKLAKTALIQALGRENFKKVKKDIIPIYSEAVKKTAAEKEQDLIDERYYLAQNGDIPSQYKIAIDILQSKKPIKINTSAGQIDGTMELARNLMENIAYSYSSNDMEGEYINDAKKYLELYPSPKTDAKWVKNIHAFTTTNMFYFDCLNIGCKAVNLFCNFTSRDSMLPYLPITEFSEKASSILSHSVKMTHATTQWALTGHKNELAMAVTELLACIDNFNNCLKIKDTAIRREALLQSVNIFKDIKEQNSNREKRIKCYVQDLNNKEKFDSSVSEELIRWNEILKTNLDLRSDIEFSLERIIESYKECFKEEVTPLKVIGGALKIHDIYTCNTAICLKRSKDMYDFKYNGKIDCEIKSTSIIHYFLRFFEGVSVIKITIYPALYPVVYKHLPSSDDMKNLSIPFVSAYFIYRTMKTK
jgi:hypothetical protein